MTKKALFISLIYTILFFLLSCHSKKPLDIIATNGANSKQLTNQLFEEWAHLNPLLKYKKKEEQIKLYFLEQYLLDKKDILNPDLINQFNFLSNLNSYTKAGQIIKRDKLSQVYADDKKVTGLFKIIKAQNQSKQDKVRIYQIYKRYPPTANDKLKKQLFIEMQSIRKNVTDLKNFKIIASTESNSQTRLKGGLLGNISEGYFNKKLNDIVMKMREGELSPIIKTNKGLILFYCEKIIPSRIKTDQQLMKSAYEYELNLEKSFTWENYNKSQLEKISPVIYWNLIHNSQPNDVNLQTKVIKTNASSISKQELLWILNGISGKKLLSQFSVEQIENAVNSFLLNKDAFEKIPLIEQNIILNENNYELNKLISNQVLSKLINEKLAPIKETDIYQYYLKNNKLFRTPKYYNISLIGLKLNEENKLEAYKKAELVYDHIINNRTNIKQAINEFSMLDILKNNGSGISFPINSISQNFGVNLYKQIKLMNQSDISDIIESDDANYLYIVKLNKIIESKPADFNQAKNHAHELLGKQNFKKTELQVINEILNDVKIFTLNSD